jgi:predicted HNH restriction endonuclease
MSKHKCKCGKTDPNDFYGTSKSQCKTCFNLRQTERGRQNRIKAIDYLGGKCSECGYNKYYGAIDIHHTDPSKKDANFRYMRGWSWKRIEAELQDCVALCRNCHTETHYHLGDITY